MGERCVRIAEVGGSNPPISIIYLTVKAGNGRLTRLFSPVVGYDKTGDSAHHRFCEGLVAVSGSSQSKLQYDTMSDVPSILCGHFVGVKNYRQEAMGFRSVFPDIAVTIIHLLADGDKVVSHVQMQGTHKREFIGVPATGKRVEWSAISIVRITNGKIAERWNIADRYVLLQRLGAIPAR